jgi:hypothetical protein
MKKSNVIKISIGVLLQLIVSGVMQVQAQSQNWSEWQSIRCHQGLDYSVTKDRSLGDDGYNQYSKKYKWLVRFRNRYQENISFNYVLKESNIFQAEGNSRITIGAGSETDETGFFLVADENTVNVFVDRVRFGDDTGPYAACGSR